MVRCASEAIANTTRELEHEAHVRIWTNAAAARGLAIRRGSGAIKHMETKYSWLFQKEKNLSMERIRGTVNPADLMTKHLDNIKHVSGRPSSAPKLTMDTQYISRASRALAAKTLVRQQAANEVAVHSGAEYETWIGEHRINCWAMAGWINRSYHDLLHSDGSGIAVVEIWKSC